MQAIVDVLENELPEDVSFEQVLERELPADPYKVLSDRELIVRSYLREQFQNGLHWYPRGGPQDGMPNSCGTVLCWLHDELERGETVERFHAFLSHVSLAFVVLLKSAIRELQNAGIDVSTIKNRR